MKTPEDLLLQSKELQRVSKSLALLLELKAAMDAGPGYIRRHLVELLESLNLDECEEIMPLLAHLVHKHQVAKLESLDLGLGLEKTTGCSGSLDYVTEATPFAARNSVIIPYWSLSFYPEIIGRHAGDSGSWKLGDRGIELKGISTPLTGTPMVNSIKCGYVANVEVTPQLPEGYEWNSAGRLPTPFIETLLNVPAGTVVVAGDGSGKHITVTPRATIMSGVRTGYLADANGDIEWRLGDNNLISGKFEWTYP